MKPGKARTLLLTAAALTAFAANSLLCRLALVDGSIDAVSFSTVRFASGAVALALMLVPFRRGALLLAGSWQSALVLFIYAIPFSFAYLRLAAGTGALILFGTVQVTMIGWDLWRGSRPRWAEWAGLGLAAGGLVLLTAPGVKAPDPAGVALMAIAGLAWGVYSLRGRGSSDPLGATAGNFVKSLVFFLLLSLAFLGQAHGSPRGLLFAIASGALASGGGYVIWYAALRRLTRTRAGIVQLAVPALAAAGGVLFLGEVITTRLVVSGIIIFAGVTLAVFKESPRLAKVPLGR